MNTATNRIGIIDLFSGVGGLSLGAARAGFRVVSSVEKDERISRAHKINFPNCIHHVGELAKFPPKDILSSINSVHRGHFGIIGGPPCQGFSSIGKKNPNDPRNDLLTTFFEYVSSLRPIFYLAENVPGILEPRNADVLANSLSHIPDSYVKLPPILLKATDFGAATNRTRVFFIGYLPEYFRDMQPNDFLEIKSNTIATVKDAFHGLPNTLATWKNPSDTTQIISEYEIDSYPSVINLPIPEGVGDKLALEQFILNRYVTGFIGTQHSHDTAHRYAELPAGKRDPISRSVKLDWDAPSPTLRAGTGPDKGSYQAVRPIHPKYARVIAPREAARLQGFPDWFQFDETIWHSFRMIGNSVSPLMSAGILKVIMSKILK